MPVTLIALPKFFACSDRVLAGRRVEHEHHLVRRALDPLGDDVADLRQLAHQVVLRVQPAGGVDDQHVDARALLAASQAS